MESVTALAARQLARDLRRTASSPVLRARKLARMTGSPHGFLRGSSPLFYEIVRDRPSLAAGPPGGGFLVGDMHLENVGAYRTDGGKLTFDINDFDDAGIGPWRYDLLRLLTSVLLSGRDFQAGGREVISLAEHTLAGWAEEVFAGRTSRSLPATIARLLAPARKRTRAQLFDARAPRTKDGKRRFVRGPRYLELPGELRRRVPDLFLRYLRALGKNAPSVASSFRIADAAFRVAGNGSLGRLRIALLVEGSDHARMFELKESSAPALAIAAGRKAAAGLAPAQRVVAASRALVKAPQKQLAPLAGGPVPLFGRRLMPEEDKLDLARLRPGPELDAVVSYVGRLVGSAHRRSARERPRPWSHRVLSEIIDRAVDMAGIHESIFLAYARMAP